MLFALVMIIATLAIAASAGYLSVIGFATTFSATFWQALVLAASLETGKLVAASFLYRYWSSAQFLLKSVMMISVAGLMIFTSAGIYGYLTSSYQSGTLTLNTTTQQVTILEEERARLLARKQEIDAQITQLPTNYVTARRQLMATFGPELEQLNARLPAIDQQLLELKTSTVSEEASVGPIIFVAKTFGIDSDRAVNYFISLVVLVLDPLAVAMTLATNHVLMRLKHDRAARKEVEDTASAPLTLAPDLAPATASPDREEADAGPSEPATLHSTEQQATAQVESVDPTPIEHLARTVASLDASLKKMTARRTILDHVRSNSLRDNQ